MAALTTANTRSPNMTRTQSFLKPNIIACIGEFLGTFTFLFLAFMGTQIANLLTAEGAIVDTSRLFYIAAVFGLSLMITVWVFYRISGAVFNPAMTIALTVAGILTPMRGLAYFFLQILGAIAAAGVTKLLTPGSAVNVQTTLNRVNRGQGFFIELIMTFFLALTIFMLAVEKHRATYLAPIGIGLVLFVAELGSVYWTGGSLNPARSFGPAVVDRNFTRDHWIYWLGPILGALFALGFYKAMKLGDYTLANPGQDSDTPSELINEPVAVVQPVLPVNSRPQNYV